MVGTRTQEGGDHDVLGGGAFVVGCECADNAFGFAPFDELERGAAAEARLRAERFANGARIDD